MILAEQMLDLFSILSLLAASSLFLYIIVKYYRGMESPPFWIYTFAGFFFITFVNFLNTTQFIVNGLILSILKFIGYLLFFIGIFKLFRIYEAKIKFDKK
jgi:hypothetical protein